MEDYEWTAIVVENKYRLLFVSAHYTNTISMEFVWQKVSFLCVGIRIEAHRKSIEWVKWNANGILMEPNGTLMEPNGSQWNLNAKAPADFSKLFPSTPLI